ncbi:hypothetical protein RD792_011720 [Penstemon davidsonii]|uniref:Beta-glucosidase n=1 Tax=Penstemon davidsonii TaxID=160366 RepID=A0ABR0CWD4_9LAMI|nr:hypothetical protein RD792_011720 [Penstemon davidsonii]
MENSRSLALVNAAAHIPIPTKNGNIVYDKDEDHSNISSTDFPDDFIFGSGTSAYQVEGGYLKGGKSLSIWDVFSLSNPGGIADGSNGNLACDSFTKYKEDIRVMKQMGFNSYRFSISWPRILPDMEPFVTLFHWDLPDCLELEYGGFLDKRVKDDFREYAEVCFWEFGDRVKYWTTLNEPWTYTVMGYVTGTFPPGDHDDLLLGQTSKKELKPSRLPNHRGVIDIGNPIPITIERYSKNRSTVKPAQRPYTVARNLLLAHSEAVHSYRTKFQERQNGKIGIVLNSNWLVPLDPNSDADVNAAKRGVDFMLGWFLDPVLYGKYPDSMIEYVPNDNLAQFSHQEAHQLKGSIDFMGLNYYTSNYASYSANPSKHEHYYKDQMVECSPFDKDGNPIGDAAGSSWLYSVPWGLYEHLKYLKTKEGMPPIYITENGWSDKNDPKLTPKEASRDTKRKKYYQDHLFYLLKAMNELKVDVRGHFAWSWCDNFEWNEGYIVRFGIMYVDFLNNYNRYPKDSAIWYSKFLAKAKAIKSTRANKKRQIEDSTTEEITEVGKKARAT